jgi:hypothetical protein
MEARSYYVIYLVGTGTATKGTAPGGLELRNAQAFTATALLLLTQRSGWSLMCSGLETKVDFDELVLMLRYSVGGTL